MIGRRFRPRRSRRLGHYQTPARASGGSDAPRGGAAERSVLREAVACVVAKALVDGSVHALLVAMHLVLTTFVEPPPPPPPSHARALGAAATAAAGSSPATAADADAGPSGLGFGSTSASPATEPAPRDVTCMISL